MSAAVNAGINIDDSPSKMKIRKESVSFGKGPGGDQLRKKLLGRNGVETVSFDELQAENDKIKTQLMILNQKLN